MVRSGPTSAAPAHYSTDPAVFDPTTDPQPVPLPGHPHEPPARPVEGRVRRAFDKILPKRSKRFRPFQIGKPSHGYARVGRLFFVGRLRLRGRYGGSRRNAVLPGRRRGFHRPLHGLHVGRRVQRWEKNFPRKGFFPRWGWGGHGLGGRIRRENRRLGGCWRATLQCFLALDGSVRRFRFDRLTAFDRRPCQLVAQGQTGVFRVQQAPGAGLGAQADEQGPGRDVVFHHDQSLQPFRRVTVAGDGAFQRSLAPGVGGAGPQFPGFAAAGIPERPNALTGRAPDVQLHPCLSPFPLHSGKAADPRPHGAQQQKFLMKFRHDLFPLWGRLCVLQGALCRTLPSAAHRLAMERRFFRRA